MDQTVICTYRVKRGAEGEFRELLRRHWPTLQRLGLVTDEPSQVFEGLAVKEHHDHAPFFMEIFTWKDGAWNAAHGHPEVMAVWEPMGALCEERGGRPAMEFPHVRRLDLK
jgi:hypothetical protein